MVTVPSQSTREIVVGITSSIMSNASALLLRHILPDGIGQLNWQGVQARDTLNADVASITEVHENIRRGS
jgi:hypothetical protein